MNKEIVQENTLTCKFQNKSVYGIPDTRYENH